MSEPFPDLNIDPTLVAADLELEAAKNGQLPRPYLGMSGIGHACARSNWYDFRWATDRLISASNWRAIEDGHHGEIVQAERLKRVSGIELYALDGDWKQFGFSDHNGHFSGHLDGAICGLIQAPVTWHVWEHKQVKEEKFNKLAKLKSDLGEKNALEKWDYTYFVQGQLYMHYSQMTRHYLTCATPGGRATISCRTDYQIDVALRFVGKAAMVIEAKEPPEKISNDPTWFECRLCNHQEICHQEKIAQMNCRTCIHSSPIEGGAWHCDALNRELSYDDQRAGCIRHLYIPKIIPGEQIDYEDGPSGFGLVTYKLHKDGSLWFDGIPF